MPRACWLVAFVCVAAGAVGMLSIGGPVTAQPTETPEATEPGLGNEVGRDLWRRDCAICHGARGGGSARGPALLRVGAAGVDYMVRTGRMPIDDPQDAVVRGKVDYTTAEIAALVDHAASFLDGPSVPQVDTSGADLAKGGELYRLNCASCHQLAGQGGVLIAGTDVPPIGPADPVEIVEAMRSGPLNMPVFPDSLLDDEEARDIAAYVQTLGDGVDEGGWALGWWGPVPEGAAAFAFGLIPAVLVARWLGQRNRPEDHEEELT